MIRATTKTMQAGSAPAEQRADSTGEARLRKLLIGALAVIGPIILLVISYKIFFPGLTNVDALDFAQVGRNVASGRGFTTFFIRPLAMTHGSNPLHQPDVVHGPLYPLCLAIAYSALGAKDSVTAGVSGVFFLLTIPIIYQLGKRAFGSKIGTISALVFTVNALSLEYATSGLPLTLCIFLTTSLLLAVYNIAAFARDNPDASAPLPKTAIVLSGVLTALLYLTEPLFIWMAPVVAITVLTVLSARRRSIIMWFVLPFVLLVTPWMVRNGMLTGNPVFGLRGSELWMGTKNNFPSMTAYRMLPSEVFARPGLLQDIARKVFTSIGIVLETWPRVGGNWVLVFFLPSLFFRFSDLAANPLRRMVLYGFLSVIAGMLFFKVDMPMLVAFVPGMLVFAVAYLVFLIQQAQLSRGATTRLTLALSAALIYPLVNGLFFNEPAVALPERSTAAMVATKAGPSDMIMTDKPWAVAWYANRPSILVPLTDTKVTEVRQKFSSMRWLLLSADSPYSGQSWTGLYKGLLAWSSQDAAAKTSNKPRPNSIQIPKDGPPLIAALSGFVTVPSEDSSPNTVVAYAP